ncbi:MULTISPECIES: DNA utilization protein GntX [Lelliottia]|uniref:DNA utilization protein GntX n=1 Tax=Lelliottia aquatilis TaxID=2080838 RepID=A0ABX5A1L6_9ENTR|nr:MULTISPECIES: DNA utilization protein GntX [Lelliottia]NTZ46739.1 DNA utilization protein GntX [Lelliottia aquatilis]POZ23048.1 DNA utilization protein GntX [Lelliottia aquatilis]POZ26135.1 DNA utilization protein GntX [Lelliottia sp. 7254-16]POZ26730.1 DNA utilization protein GntX [Lelliottia aquatilis]POZ32501.1 DNA utilization protein GntX [Lelliottia aquatilis]
MLTVPGLCWLCRMPLTISHWGVCSVCTRSFQTRTPCCPQCGLPATSVHIPCGRCLQKPPPWDALVAVDDYVQPLSGLIHKLKFSRQTQLAGPLARLLVLAVLHARRTRNLPAVDLLISVPLHHRRHWRRGYNQSEVLCHPLAHWLRCSYHPVALKRTHATAIQHQLSARLRKRNLKNAFRLELSVKGRHIAIVDDVVTTGSTVAELSRLLLQSGAATVQVWCLCRTL